MTGRAGGGGASYTYTQPFYQAGAFADTLPPADPNSAAVIRVHFASSVSAVNGFIISARAINYAGPETYCDGTGNCATLNVTLTTGPGFDGLTGLGSAGARFVPAMAKF